MKYFGHGNPMTCWTHKGSHFKSSENVAEVVINLEKKHHRKEPSYYMVQRMRPAIQKECGSLYANTDISFVEPPAGPPVLAAIVAEVYGDDAKGIRELSNSVAGIFKRTSGLVDVEVMQDEVYDKVEVEADSTKIALSGVDIKQLNNILYLAFEGMQIAVKNSDVMNDQIPIFLTLSR
jgi:multidrug efflux pump subunit AcrB